MRPIKFRAWDSHHKRYREEGDFAVAPGGNVLWEKDGWHDTVAFQLSIEQFTGLHDKNGREIYEGDIVRILYTDWPSKSPNDPRSLDQYLTEISDIGHVVYEAPEFHIEFKDTSCGSLLAGKYGRMEVIGNVHQNPELLK